MDSKILLGLLLSLLVYAAAVEDNSGTCSRSAQQCRLRRLRVMEPSRRIVSEGGLLELWDANEDGFQCAGVAAMRQIVQPNAMSQPNFQPAPLLVYIEKGEGLLGVTYPGCAETFESESPEELRSRRGSQGSLGEEQTGRRRSDQHQKIHRIRRGDIVAIPAGAPHWCYNDGDQELIAFAVIDLNNHANQLDQQFRSFLLAGGEPRQSQRGQGGRLSFQNVFRGFNTELLAEAFQMPPNIVRRLQENDDRGLVVKCKEEMRRMIRPEEEKEEEEEGGGRRNGLEETICTMRVRYNVDARREPDIVSLHAGRINIVNRHKLPILRYIEMSAEKGHLLPNAIYTPAWSITDHRVVYVTRGEAHVQIVDDRANTVFEQRVARGDVFVIPQFYTAMTRAGNNGFEYVSIKTSGQPMKSPLAGYTSVIRAMPIDVITNSFRMSPEEARQLKYNRGRQSTVLSSGRGST